MLNGSREITFNIISLVMWPVLMVKMLLLEMEMAIVGIVNLISCLIHPMKFYTPKVMNDNYLRDRTGHIIARQDGNWLRDGQGKLVAKYDKSDDRTRDRNGRIVGSGDQRLRELGKRA